MVRAERQAMNKVNYATSCKNVPVLNVSVQENLFVKENKNNNVYFENGVIAKLTQNGQSRFDRIFAIFIVCLFYMVLVNL